MMPDNMSVGGQCPVHYQPLGTCCQPAAHYVDQTAVAVEMVAAANRRAEALAVRIVQARQAIQRGLPSTAVLSILDGSPEPGDSEAQT